MNFRQKIDPKEIIEIGILAKNSKITYREIGEKYNVSKERIRQLLNQYFPRLTQERKQSRMESCLTCGKECVQTSLRSFRGELYCQECRNKIIESRKGKWSFDYDACTQCHKTTSNNHSNGVCIRCYSK